jgi:tetratricopeptide (TPR) repeat protein
VVRFALLRLIVTQNHLTHSFIELKKSTETPEHFWQQKHPIYNRNHWTAYEVFLKATWDYLCDCNNERSPTGVMVLYRKLWLYRRRHGQLRAANTVAKKLEDLLKELPERDIAWIVGKVKYEIAYMKFMEDPLDTQVIGIFEDSARLERKVGNQSGALVSHATALMVRLLQENSSLFDDFLRTQDSLSRYSDHLAIHWCKYNLNYLMAIGEVISGGNGVRDKLKTMLPDETGHSISEIDEMEHLATWVAGSDLMNKSRDVSVVVPLLENSLRIANRIHQAEGRAGLCVALGDAYHIQGRFEKAQEMWKRALREPRVFLNQHSIDTAKSRIHQGVNATLRLDKIHFLFDRRTWIR